MSRKDDLEQNIRESYSLIREYEAIRQATSDPKERVRCNRGIKEQWTLVEGYLTEYRLLAGESIPPDIGEIIVRFAIADTQVGAPLPAHPRPAPLRPRELPARSPKTGASTIPSDASPAQVGTPGELLENRSLSIALMVLFMLTVVGALLVSYQAATALLVGVLAALFCVVIAHQLGLLWKAVPKEWAFAIILLLALVLLGLGSLAWRSGYILLLVLTQEYPETAWLLVLLLALALDVLIVGIVIASKALWKRLVRRRRQHG